MIDKIEANLKIAEFLGGTTREIWKVKGKSEAAWFGNIAEKYRSELMNMKIGSAILQGSLKFDSDWNWLIPVVEKIESLDLSPYFYSWVGFEEEEYNNFRYIEVDISRNHCTIFIELELDPPELVGGNYEINDNTKLENTYEAVIEFVNYYNDLVKRKTQ